MSHKPFSNNHLKCISLILKNLKQANKIKEKKIEITKKTNEITNKPAINDFRDIYKATPFNRQLLSFLAIHFPSMKLLGQEWVNHSWPNSSINLQLPSDLLTRTQRHQFAIGHRNSIWHFPTFFVQGDFIGISGQTIKICTVKAGERL